MAANQANEELLEQMTEVAAQVSKVASNVSSMSGKLQSVADRLATVESKVKQGTGVRKCFRCGSTEHAIADCPEDEGYKKPKP